MPQLLPDLLFPSPTPRGLSLAELCAARLDGELFALDEGFSPVDHPTTLTLRLRAVAPLLGGRVVLERQSALWAYGLRPFPPNPHQGCLRSGSGRRTRGSARLHIREVVADDDDFVNYDGVRLTSMLRTAVDIARGSERFGARELDQLSRLLVAAGAGPADCLAQLDRSRNTPNRVRALERLHEALRLSCKTPVDVGSASADAVHVVDRVDAPHSVQHPVQVGGVTHLEDEAADRQAVA